MPELREQTPGWRKILRGLRDPGDTEHSLAGILQFRQAGKFCANTAEFCAGITECGTHPAECIPTLWYIGTCSAECISALWYIGTCSQKYLSGTCTGTGSKECN